LVRAYFQLSKLADHRNTKLAYLNKALESALKESPTDNDVPFVYHEIALIHYREKNYFKTLENLQKALITASADFQDTSYLKNPPIDKLRYDPVIADILSLKGYAVARINTSDKTYTKLALQCSELAAEFLNKRLNNIDVEFSGLAVAEKRRQLLSDAVSYANYIYRYTGEEEYAEIAFYNSEKAKAQLLKMYTEKPEILKKAGVPDSVIMKSEKLGNEILDLENSIALTAIQKKDISKLTGRLTYLYDQRDFLNYDISMKYSDYREVRYDLRLPGINEIRSVLESDQALVEYEMRPGQLITFVITKSEFYQYAQPINNETTKHIENLRRLISANPAVNFNDSSFSDFTKSSFFLYNLLIKPIYKKIKGKRLIIIPNRSLSLIPFEVLISEKYEGRHDYRNLHWLIDEFPVIYAFSASFLFDNALKKYGKGIAAFVPDYSNHKDKKLSVLEGAANEARFLKKIMNCRIFSGAKSDEKNFIAESPDYRILHIATHTEIDDNRPDLSCFIMDKSSDSIDDGRLYAFEIKQLRLNAQLAVLSGCNTGYGKLRLSEGFLSLARSFFFTGIRTVAFTIWSIADKSSEDIIEQFYKEIHNGTSLDIAMMKSKVSFIDNADPVKAHPYYWAGFIIAGRSQGIPHERYDRQYYIFIILILAAGASFIAFKKIRG
jgi:CHAT domain-containing protein